MAIDLQFAGHQLNAVDAKGRVSVPSTFRGKVAERLQANGRTSEDRNGGVLMVIPHRKSDRLMAYDQVGIDILAEELREDVADLPAAERREALAEAKRAMHGNVTPIPYDGAGRMVLSPTLRDIAGITDLAYFISAGGHFEIWSPEQAKAGFAKDPMALRLLESHMKAREA